MDADQSVWEQELYNEIEYKRKDKLFHCFEGDSAHIGFSFMDEIEANHFHEKVQERISKRRARQSQYYSAKPHGVGERKGKQSDRKSKSLKKKSADRSSSNAASLWHLWKKKDKKDGKPKLSIRDIGAPDSNSFMHVQGVKPSFEGSGGFEMVDNTEVLDNMDPRIKEFLMIAGLDEKMMANPKKAKQVKEWAETNNVYDIMDRSTGVKPLDPKETSRPTRPPPRPRATKGGVLPAPPPPPPPLGELTKRESIKKRTSANFLSELGEKKLNPAKEVDHNEMESLDEVDRGLDDLIKDALARFRDDINDSSDSDSSDNDDEDSGWSDN